MDHKGQGRGREAREEVKLIQAGGEGDLAKKGAGRWQEVAGFLELSPSLAAVGPLSLGSFCRASCSSSASQGASAPDCTFWGSPGLLLQALSLVSCQLPSGDVERQIWKSNGLLVPLSGWATDLRNLVPTSP